MPKRWWMSSDRSNFIRFTSNLALNLSGDLPDEGRGRIVTVVDIVLFVRLSFFDFGERLVNLFWIFGGVTRLFSESGLILIISA